MNAFTKTLLTLVVVTASTHASSQVTFYENQDFQGRSFTAQTKVPNFARFGFNERASSATVTGERWEVCEDARSLKPNLAKLGTLVCAVKDRP